MTDKLAFKSRAWGWTTSSAFTTNSFHMRNMAQQQKQHVQNTGTAQLLRNTVLFEEFVSTATWSTAANTISQYTCLNLQHMSARPYGPTCII